MANPAPAGGAAVDPNIQAILAQHNQSLALLRNQQQAEQTHRQASQQAQQANQQHRCGREDEEDLRRWIQQEEKRMDSCEGAPKRAVREWLRCLHEAGTSVPPGMGNDSAGKALIKATSRGHLYAEYLSFLNRQLNPAAVPVAQVLAHLSEAFLGPDEDAVLKEDVKGMRQGEREDLCAYNRRFSKTSELAYPFPRAGEIERTLTEYYVGSLVNGKIKDSVFDAEPRIVVLQTAMDAAAAEWSRRQYRGRVQQNVPKHEPMEVNVGNTEVPRDPPLRETVEIMAKTIRDLQREMEKMRTTGGAAGNGAGRQANAPRSVPPRFSGRGARRGPGPGRGGRAGWQDDRSCYSCGAPGHIARRCPRNQPQGPQRPGE